MKYHGILSAASLGEFWHGEGFYWIINSRFGFDFFPVFSRLFPHMIRPIFSCFEI